jgi:hypothetical protein
LLTVSQRFAKHCSCCLEGGYRIHPETPTALSAEALENFQQSMACSYPAQASGEGGGRKKCATRAVTDF